MPFPFYNTCERLEIKYNSEDNPQVIDGKRVQSYIGLIAIFWPLVLMVGNIIFGTSNMVFEDSISAYYHSDMKIIFTGGLFVIGVSMLAYCGFHPIDGNLGNAAGVLAILVALFPVDALRHEDFSFGTTTNMIHYASALTLFVVLAYFCLAIFTLSHDSNLNKKFKLCGWVIIVSILGMAIDTLIFKEESINLIGDLKLFLVLEVITLWAFGFSWLLKGDFYGLAKKSDLPENYRESLIEQYNNDCQGSLESS